MFGGLALPHSQSVAGRWGGYFGTTIGDHRRDTLDR